MSDVDDVLPTALDCKKISAEIESKKAADSLRAREAAEKEKKDLIDRLLIKPSAFCFHAHDVLAHPFWFEVDI